MEKLEDFIQEIDRLEKMLERVETTTQMGCYDDNLHDTAMKDSKDIKNKIMNSDLEEDTKMYLVKLIRSLFMNSASNIKEMLY